jgi:hypothetical protein
MEIDNSTKLLLNKFPELIEVIYDTKTNNILLKFKDSFKALSIETRFNIMDKVIESLITLSYGTPLVSVCENENEIIVQNHSYYNILSLASQANLLFNVSKSIKKLAEQLQQEANLTTERLQ